MNPEHWLRTSIAGMIGGKFRRRMREEKIFRKPPLVFRNRSEALEFFRVDDGQVQARFGAVVKENGIDHFARPSRQPEGNIGNAENGARVRQRSLDQAMLPSSQRRRQYNFHRP